MFAWVHTVPEESFASENLSEKGSDPLQSFFGRLHKICSQQESGSPLEMRTP